MSTTEAEFVAQCSAVKDGGWFNRILVDLKVKVKKLIVYEDNQGCISLVKNPENNRRVRHMDFKYNFVHDKLKNNKLMIHYINTKSQQADILTKGLPGQQFCKMKDIRLLEDEN